MLGRLLRRLEAPNLHHSLVAPPTYDRTPVFPEGHPPNSVAGFGQVPHSRPGLHIKQLDMPVIPTGNKKSVVELQASNRGVVCGYLVAGFRCPQREGDDATVRASGDESVTADLEVTNERRVALYKRRTCTGK